MKKNEAKLSYEICRKCYWHGQLGKECGEIGKTGLLNGSFFVTIQTKRYIFHVIYTSGDITEAKTKRRAKDEDEKVFTDGSKNSCNYLHDVYISCMWRG